MSNSESSRSSSVGKVFLIGLTLVSAVQAAPLDPRKIRAGSGPCTLGYSRQTNYAQQCIPTTFARVWHTGVSFRPSSVTTLPNQSIEWYCFDSILKTGKTFKQYTWNSVTGACTFTEGDTTMNKAVASTPGSDNIIATNFAGTCASTQFSSKKSFPGIPCQNMIWTQTPGTPVYTLGQAEALAHLH